MKINNYEIKRAESIKFPDVLLDENLIYYLKANHFSINNLFYLYTTDIFIAALTMTMWLGEVHI